MAIIYKTGSVTMSLLSTTFSTLNLNQVYSSDLNNDGNSDLLLFSASYPYNGPAVAQPALVAFGTGNGGFRIATQAEFPTASLSTVHTREVVFADFNGDSLKDVFVGNHGYDAMPFPGEQNQLFLSSANGTWINATASLPQISDYTHSAAAGDVNGDGAIDILVGNVSQPNPVLPYVLMNNGTGSFTRNDGLLPVSTGGALSENVRRIVSETLADLDNDGREDLVLGAGFSTDARPVSNLILWNQDGSFAQSPSTVLPFPVHSGKMQNTYDIQAVDVNFDGRLDLVLAYQRDVGLGGWELQVLVNKGNREFADETSTYLPDVALQTNGVPGATSPESQYWVQFLNVTDLNKDGRMDLVLDARGITRAPSSLPVAYIHQADGTFAAATVADLGGVHGQWLFDYSTQYAYWNNGGGFVHLAQENGNLHLDVLPATFTATQGILVPVSPGAGGWTINGTATGDSLTGGTGNDTFNGGAGNDVIEGGIGSDTALYGGSRAAYTIMRTAAGFSVNDSTGVEGKDTLVSVERLSFGDASLAVQHNDVVQSLYVAYFGRAADAVGLINFQNALAQAGAPTDLPGLSALYGTNAAVRSLIDAFGNSQESKDLYGSGDIKAFVTAIYNNVISRAPDSQGLQFWVDAIDNKGLSKGNAALSIMSGALSDKSPQGLLDGALVKNKLAAASNFTFAIDTSLEVTAYSGNAAAATVRTMLSVVGSSTDLDVFQNTVSATLTGLVNKSGLRMQSPMPAAESVTLVGVQESLESNWI